MLLRVLFLVAGLGGCVALKFPTYLKKCARSDPELNACALASARAAKSHLVRGDRALRLPSLDPLLVSRLSVEQSGSVGINITLTDLVITGFNDLTFTDNFNLDLVGGQLNYEAEVPRLEINSDYEMKGKILVLPITGKGRANITSVGLSMKVVVPFKLATRANGKEYMELEESKLAINQQRAYFAFTNLFNGDPLLGPQTNLFLNENWRELVDEVGPSIAEGIGAAIQQALQGFADKFPYNELIPKTLS